MRIKPMTDYYYFLPQKYFQFGHMVDLAMILFFRLLDTRESQSYPQRHSIYVRIIFFNRKYRDQGRVLLLLLFFFYTKCVCRMSNFFSDTFP